MFRVVILGVLASFLCCGTLAAQTCGSLPYTLTNGTTANAVLVMGDFGKFTSASAPDRQFQIRGQRVHRHSGAASGDH